MYYGEEQVKAEQANSKTQRQHTTRNATTATSYHWNMVLLFETLFLFFSWPVSS
jgi:hypothetical protein